jgi:hypothetical protein
VPRPLLSKYWQVPDHAAVSVDTFVDGSGVAKMHDLFIGSSADDPSGSMHKFAA